jgi:LysM repeat protein
MKRISAFTIACILCAAGLARGQDGAVSSQEIQENYKSLKGHVQDMIDAQAAQDKKLQALAREIADLREQAGKPTGNYATQDDLKRLADAIQEIDRKREADKALILKEISKLGKTIATPPPAVHNTPTAPPPHETPATTKGDETGFTYEIKSGDTYMVIAQAYRDQGVKVTADQIEKANPGVNPKGLKIGQKIFIPAPKATTASK